MALRFRYRFAHSRVYRFEKNKRRGRPVLTPAQRLFSADPRRLHGRLGLAVGPLGNASGSQVWPLIMEGGLPGPRPPGGPVRKGSYSGRLCGRNCTSAYRGDEMREELVVQSWAAFAFASVTVQLENIQFSGRKCTRSGVEASPLRGWRVVCGQGGGKARVSACPPGGRTGHEGPRARVRVPRRRAAAVGGAGAAARCLRLQYDQPPPPWGFSSQAGPAGTSSPVKASPAGIHSAASHVTAGGAGRSCPLAPWRLIGVPAQAG